MKDANTMRRLQSERGETLVEALVAVLISALGMLLLATSIMSTKNIIESGNKVISNYYENEVALADHGEAGGSVGSVEIKTTDNNSVATCDVSYWKATIGSETVTAYELK